LYQGLVKGLPGRGKQCTRAWYNVYQTVVLDVVIRKTGVKSLSICWLQERFQQIGEGHKLRDGELFGTQGEEPYSQLLSSREGSGSLKGLLEGGDGVGAEQLAQGDAQHLTALVEDGLHDAAEELLVAAEGVDVVARHADDGRLHLGWRVEDGGLDGEEILDIVPRLDEHGEDAVGLRTGLGGHAQRHLMLDHSRTAGDEVAVVEHLEEDLRRDVVGVVAREHELAAAEELAEVHAEEVAGD